MEAKAPVRESVTAARAAAPGSGIGLALGGGGARGLAHIPVLEAFDSLGVRPAKIAATSIGAIIGAAYASGLSAADLRDYCSSLLARRSTLLRQAYSRWSGSLWDLWNPRTPAFFSSVKLMEIVLPDSLKKTFEELSPPLVTVATDFYQQSAHISQAGPLLPAVAASSALPILLKPVILDGRVLIDGGFVNPLPFDLLRPDMERIIAIDVSGGRAEGHGGTPNSAEAIIGAHQIALRSIINEKLKCAAPDCLIRPDVSHFRALDFLKQEEILAAAESAREQAKRALDQILSASA